MRFPFVSLLCLAACAAPMPTKTAASGPTSPFSATKFVADLQDDDVSIHKSRESVRGVPRAEWEPVVHIAFKVRLAEKKWFAAAQIAVAFELEPEYFEETLSAAKNDDDWESVAAIGCGLGAPASIKRAVLRTVMDEPHVPQRRAMRRALKDHCPVTEADLMLMLYAALEAHDERLTLNILTHSSLPRSRVVAALHDMFVSREVRGSTARHHLYCSAEAHCKQAVEAAVTIGLTPEELRTVIDKHSCEDDERLQPFPPDHRAPQFRAIHDAAMAVGNYRVALLTIHATKWPPAYLPWFIDDVFRNRKEAIFTVIPDSELHRERMLTAVIKTAIERQRFWFAAIITQDDTISRRMFDLAIAAGKFAEAGEIAAQSAPLKYSGPLDAMYAALRAGDIKSANRLRIRFDISRKIYNASLDHYRPHRISRR